MNQNKDNNGNGDHFMKPVLKANKNDFEGAIIVCKH
jgi:hypothetical protein